MFGVSLMTTRNHPTFQTTINNGRLCENTSIDISKYKHISAPIEKNFELVDFLMSA